MERIPIKAPLPCFSLEFDKADPRCANCPHRIECRAFMGKRARPRLSELSFNFTPKLEETQLPSDPELNELQQLYERCYLTIFERAPTDRLDRRPRAAEILQAACDQTGCTLRMFMLASMFGHRATAPQRTFYANALLGPYAIRRAELYRGACSKAFGTFDLQALNNVMKTQDQGLEAKMLNSEIIAGQWIVGYKLRYPGAYGLPFYQSKELALDPYWLAIEDSYIRLVLLPNRGVHSEISELNRHRYAVSKVHHELKKDSRRKGRQTKAVFSIRERNAPIAIKRVLVHYGFSPDDFTTRSPEVTDMMTLWGQLSIAMKNYFVERLVDHDFSALAYLRS